MPLKKSLRKEKSGGPVHLIEPRFAKPLLALHGAMDMESFWQASQRVLQAAMPSHLIAAFFQMNPTMPMLAICNRRPNSTPDWFPDFLDLHPVLQYVAAHPDVRFVRTSDIFPQERDLLRHRFYRRFMKREGWKYSCNIIIHERRRTIGIFGLCRRPSQGEFTPVEMRLLRGLYPHLQVALRRVGQVERERVRRAAFEKFFRRLPLPTLLLNWNLRIIYENRAARDFCARWAFGPAARGLKSNNLILPAEVLRECERLKQTWAALPRSNTPLPSPRAEPIRHPHWPYLLAKVEIQQLKTAAVGRPHFLVQFEYRRKEIDRPEGPDGILRHLVRLTAREREMVACVCRGHSNREIAERICCSLPTVKKHLHAIFNKLEVSSRSRLMALLR